MAKSKPRTSLDDLFQVEEGINALDNLKMVRRGKIILEPQIRKTIPDEDIRDRRENILELRNRKLGINGSGILQPLSISPFPGRPGFYTLNFGHTRYVSTGEWEGGPVTHEELPCIIEPGNDNSRSLVQLVENLLHVNLNPVDEALGVTENLRKTKMKQAELATILGYNTRWVENRHRVGKTLDKESPDTYLPDVADFVTTVQWGKGKPNGVTLTNLTHIVSIPDPEIRAKLLPLLYKPITEPELVKKIQELVPETPAQKEAREKAAAAKAAKEREEAEAKEAREKAAREAQGEAGQGGADPGAGGGSGGGSGFGGPTFFGQAGGTTGGVVAAPGTSGTGAVADDLGNAPIPGNELDLLQQFVYPANARLSLGAQLLESQEGMLDTVPEAALREAASALDKQAKRFRDLYKLKRQAGSKSPDVEATSVKASEK